MQPITTQARIPQYSRIFVKDARGAIHEVTLISQHAGKIFVQVKPGFALWLDRSRMVEIAPGQNKALVQDDNGAIWQASVLRVTSTEILITFDDCPHEPARWIDRRYIVAALAEVRGVA